MTRLSINVHEAKTHLSKYLKKVQGGQPVILCKNGEPIAQIIPLSKKQNCWQYLGIAKDLIGKIPSDFDEALSEKELPGFGL